MDSNGEFPILGTIATIGAISAGGYTSYYIYKVFDRLFEHREEAQQACKVYSNNPTNVNLYKKKEKKISEAFKSGGEAALSVPGTSVQGPPPVNRLELIIHGSTTYLNEGKQ